MGQQIISHVPELLAKKGWSSKTFVANCMLAGMGQGTAYRIASGDTNIKVETLRVVASVLGVSIGEIIEISEQ